MVKILVCNFAAICSLWSILRRASHDSRQWTGFVQLRPPPIRGPSQIAGRAVRNRSRKILKRNGRRRKPTDGDHTADRGNPARTSRHTPSHDDRGTGHVRLNREDPTPSSFRVYLSGLPSNGSSGTSRENVFRNFPSRPRASGQTSSDSLDSNPGRRANAGTGFHLASQIDSVKRAIPAQRNSGERLHGCGLQPAKRLGCSDSGRAQIAQARVRFQRFRVIAGGIS